MDSLPLNHQGIPDKKVVGMKLGFPGGSVIKNLLANAGDAGVKGLIPGLGRPPEGVIGNRLSILA